MENSVSGDATPGWKALRNPWHSAIKRVLDITVSIIGLVAAVPSWPFLAMAIKLSSCGPVFYLQARVGRGRKIFSLVKFRSMVADAENGDAVWAKENDPRVTFIGRVLRRFHLDEWPQLWNVLQGDMSLVGPRPERPEFVCELELDIPRYGERFAAKPGITGLAQVRFKYAATVEDARIKLNYDLDYIFRSSLYLDLSILLRTFDVVLRGGPQ